MLGFPMLDEIQALSKEILAAIAGAATPDALEAVRIQYLARSGSWPKLLEGMAKVPSDQKPVVGKAANAAKTEIAAAFDARKAELTAAAESADFDPTLPGRYEAPGSLHPVLQTRDRAIEIFRRLGFALADGPDIENEVFNFDALNTPPDHPARNEQDTFYLKEDGLAPSPGLKPGTLGGRRLMRTQTSTVQIRAMLAQPPPIRIIAPGRCYRRDEIDATHGMSFFQMEGLVVGWKSAAAAWSIPRSSSRSATIRRSTAATPSALASSASPSCATASPICASSPKTTSASCASSARGSIPNCSGGL
jgi:phenylalanyl-tRNA synthetase alpha chain